MLIKFDWLIVMRRILIVDDESSILSGLSRVINKFCDFHGEIKAVENGEKAMNAISSCYYDISFLDINLPDINGLDIMGKINDISPETKVVIMTADSVSDEMMRKIENGASLFITKPIELDIVKAFVNNVFDNTSGIVKWSLKDEKDYRAGIKFI
jgi:DNA-binding NtrC family response regulator